MTAGTLEWLLQAFSLLGCLITIVRLVQLRLFRVYPFFLSYLFIPLSIQTVVMRYGVCSPQLCRTYPYLELLRNVGYVLVVWELASAVFRSYADSRPLRQAVGWAISVAPIGLILTFVAPHSYLFRGLILRVVSIERGIAFSLAIFAFVVLTLVSQHPLKLSRHSIVLGIFGLWFLADSATLMAGSFLPRGHLYLVNDCLALFEIGAYIGWCSYLRQTNPMETRPMQQFCQASATTR